MQNRAFTVLTASVLAAREPHLQPKTVTLADLYDPLSMPPALVKAHSELDRAVEKCYRPEPFHSDRERVEFLFAPPKNSPPPLSAAAEKKTKWRRAGVELNRPTIIGSIRRLPVRFRFLVSSL